MIKRKNRALREKQQQEANEANDKAENSELAANALVADAVVQVESAKLPEAEVPAKTALVVEQIDLPLDAVAAFDDLEPTMVQNADNADQEKEGTKEGTNQEMAEAKEGNNQEDDYEGETRCTCSAMAEGGGKMIQCDDCKCWQHMECMGLIGIVAEEDEDAYYCEQCKPGNSKQQPSGIL
jgi:hypothetical protein